jgi:hypothetical protein
MENYNEKQFLLPDSERSMACYHAKVINNVMKLTIHDCKGSIQLHNDLSNPEELNEALNKLEALASGIVALQDVIYQNYKKY